MNVWEIIQWTLALVCTLSMLVFFMNMRIKTGQRKYPPYHKVNENGDIAVYLFEWSRGRKYSGDYHEYLFVKTINGLAYKCSKRRKFTIIFWISFFTIICMFPVILIILDSTLKFQYFIFVFWGYILAVSLLLYYEYVNLCIAKKYLKEIEL